MQHKRILRWLTVVVWGFVGMGCFAHLAYAAEDTAASSRTKPRANRLAKETSPYLLLHAHNPVDWYAWGPEAFEKATKEQKLIFLSVGYSSCYWCHVMERKVFTNEEIAKTLNQNFVCIKVDREERPDIDDIYMTALQVYYQAIGAPSGGGWPLSMFLTPDGKPVAGGTYFPPEDSAGTQGFPTILSKLIDLWASKRDQMTANADILTTETKRLMRPKVSLKPAKIDVQLSETVFVATVASFDSDFGGVDFNFKSPEGPKFPTPVKLMFIQQHLEQTPNEVAKLLDLTLLQMACGGIRDHVGGGFHRYSVDRRWDVPHFEKMLYDQAQLAIVYAQAYESTKRPLYKQVAEEILEFVSRELTSPEGGFYSALDAETNGVEGEFYVWDAAEINKILETSAAPFKDMYRVKDLSDFEHGNVLRLSPKRLPKSVPADANATVGKLSGSEQDEFATAKQKLLLARDKRSRPLRDDKILTCWNGLMIGAYARAATLLQHPEYIQTAERAADLILSKSRDSQGRLLHSYTSDQAKLNAYLDDYAFLVDGLLALHEASDNVKWLNAARKMQDDQLRMFLDVDNGGFFFTSHHHEELLARTKNCYDGVLPAGNSVSARNLIKLAKLTDTEAYLDEARAVIELFAPQVETSPRACASLGMAVTELLEADGGPKTNEDSNSGAVAQNDVITASQKEEAGANKEPLIILADQKDPPAKEELIKARAYLSTDKLPAGGTSQLVVLLNVKEGWHINSNPPSPEEMKPTKVSFDSKLKVKMSDPKYPAGHIFKSADGEVQVYEGEVAIRGTLTVPEKAVGQVDEMVISIEYQACNDKTCLPPKTIKLTGKLDVAKKGEMVKPVNARLFPPPKTGQNPK